MVSKGASRITDLARSGDSDLFGFVLGAEEDSRDAEKRKDELAQVEAIRKKHEKVLAQLLAQYAARSRAFMPVLLGISLLAGLVAPFVMHGVVGLSWDRNNLLLSSFLFIAVNIASGVILLSRWNRKNEPLRSEISSEREVIAQALKLERQVEREILSLGSMLPTSRN